MNKKVLLQELVNVYLKHGWALRRLLLTPETQNAAAAQIEKFVDANNALIVENDFDAAWFARAAGNKRESWELRLVQTAPYALFEMLDGDLTEAAREARLAKIENKMRGQAIKPVA